MRGQWHAERRGWCHNRADPSENRGSGLSRSPLRLSHGTIRGCDEKACSNASSGAGRKPARACGAATRRCGRPFPRVPARTLRRDGPLDTDLERISLGGPRIKDLRDLFVIESGAQSRLRTLSVLIAYEYRGWLTQERIGPSQLFLVSR